MAKRFIDTNLFDDNWFMNLSKEEKLLWIYLITKCNHAGIIEYNKKLWSFQTDLNSLETVIKGLGNRLIRVKETDYYFIPKFLKYQYPNFPNSKVKAQASAIKILQSFDLYTKENIRVIKGLDNSYDNDNDNEYDYDSVIGIYILKKKYLENERLVDVILNQNKEISYKTILELTNGLDKFNLMLQSKGILAESWSNYAEYFLNWSKKQKAIKKDNSPFSNMAF